MFYSKSSGGFYDIAIHGAAMPSDVVEITVDDHAALLDAQSCGKVISAGANGYPFALNPLPPSAEKMWERIKAERNRRIESGGYQVDGKWFHSDSQSRSQQLALVFLGTKIQTDLQWKTMDGSFVTMSPSLAQKIVEAAALSDQAIFARAEAHRAEMEVHSEPASYDYFCGWPTIFGDLNEESTR